MTFEFLCSYLAELTLMDYGMLNYLPSMVAAACVTVALVMLGKPHWTATLSHYSGYLPRDLRHCAQVCGLVRGSVAGGQGGVGFWPGAGSRGNAGPLLWKALPPGEHGPHHLLPPSPRTPSLQAVHALFVQAKTSNLPASRDKYASLKYASVSQLGCPDALPEWMFQ